jgi:hypothetical protein
VGILTNPTKKPLVLEAFPATAYEAIQFLSNPSAAFGQAQFSH